jgi:hypothetical protein
MISAAAGSIVTRDSTTDVVLDVPHDNGRAKIAVAAGVRIVSDMVGLREYIHNMNPSSSELRIVNFLL